MLDNAKRSELQNAPADECSSRGMRRVSHLIRGRCEPVALQRLQTFACQLRRILTQPSPQASSPALPPGARVLQVHAHFGAAVARQAGLNMTEPAC